MSQAQDRAMGIFERYLSVWIACSIIIGVVLGNLIPNIFRIIASLTWAHVNFVVAFLIWVMIYPMMAQIDFTSIKEIRSRPEGLILTLLVNWLIKPFTMAGLGWPFFKIHNHSVDIINRTIHKNTDIRSASNW